MFKRILRGSYLLVLFCLFEFLFWNILLGPSLIIYALIAVTFLFTK
jgi:hypothetical protein